MARTQTTVADAITAVNTIVSSQATTLAQIKSALQGKAAGSGGGATSGQVYDAGVLTLISGMTASADGGVLTIGG